MTDRPIIFSAPMVRKLLEGRKTQTRRLLKVRQPHRANKLREDDNAAWFCDGEHLKNQPCEDHAYRIPIYFMPGDRLYVREAIDKVSEPGAVFYRADYDAENPGGSAGLGWRPSIHMPRWASRLTLTVTEVRVQRLQEISEADAVAEGVPLSPDDIADNERLRTAVLLPHIDAIYGDRRPYRTAAGNYAMLWNSLHGPDAWDANPWVVAVSFTVQRGNIDRIGGDK